MSPGANSMSRSASAPEGLQAAVSEYQEARKQGWNNRHGVIFAKDNHHYHPNFR